LRGREVEMEREPHLVLGANVRGWQRRASRVARHFEAAEQRQEITIKRRNTMSVSVKLDPKKKILTIKMPLEKARRSASGKTLVVGSTHGCKTGEAVHSGRPIVVVASAFIYPDEQSKSSDRNPARRRKAGWGGELQHPTEEE
jgi:hypothetical protein